MSAVAGEAVSTLSLAASWKSSSTWILPSERRLTRTREKAEIKADVQDALPLNSSGIVALFEEQWADEK